MSRIKKIDEDGNEKNPISQLEYIINTYYPGLTEDDLIGVFDKQDLLYAPAQKCTEECKLYESCKVKDKVSYGSPCPARLALYYNNLNKTLQQLEIDPSDLIEIERAWEFVVLGLLEQNMVQDIFSRGLIVEKPLVVDGTVEYSSEPNDLMHYLLRTVRVRGEILEEFLATKKAKVKYTKEENKATAILSAFREIENADYEIEESQEGGTDNDKREDNT